MEILVKTIFSGSLVFAQALARGARACAAQDERERAERTLLSAYHWNRLERRLVRAKLSHRIIFYRIKILSNFKLPFFI